MVFELKVYSALSSREVYKLNLLNRRNLVNFGDVLQLTTVSALYNSLQYNLLVARIDPESFDRFDDDEHAILNYELPGRSEISQRLRDHVNWHIIALTKKRTSLFTLALFHLCSLAFSIVIDTKMNI